MKGQLLDLWYPSGKKSRPARLEPTWLNLWSSTSLDQVYKEALHTVRFQGDSSCTKEWTQQYYKNQAHRWNHTFCHAKQTPLVYKLPLLWSQSGINFHSVLIDIRLDCRVILCLWFKLSHDMIDKTNINFLVSVDISQVW